MPSLKQLEQQKADLDIKIAKSLEIANKVELQLHKARLRQQAVDKCSTDIKRLLDDYGLHIKDVIPYTSPGGHAFNKQGTKTYNLWSLLGIQEEVEHKHIHEIMKLQKK